MAYIIAPPAAPNAHRVFAGTPMETSPCQTLYTGAPARFVIHDTSSRWAELPRIACGYRWRIAERPAKPFLIEDSCQPPADARLAHYDVEVHLMAPQRQSIKSTSSSGAPVGRRSPKRPPWSAIHGATPG
jgi:hypothetical protein